MIRAAVVAFFAAAALAACVPALPGGSLGESPDGSAVGAAGSGQGGTAGTMHTMAGGPATGGAAPQAGAGGSAVTGLGGAGGISGPDASAGATGGWLPCPALATFDMDTQGFVAGSSVNIVASTRISWSPSQGDPVPGALAVGIPFTDYNQSADVEHPLGSTPANWTGYRLHVRVKVAAGGNADPLYPMGVEPYAHTGWGPSFCGSWQSVPAGNGWKDYVLDLAACDDPSMVRAYGVRLLTGTGADGDGGMSSVKPAFASVFVDSFWLEGSCGAAGGG